ncbi:MAG: RNA chaperone Hfq [bacterium]|nr:RNA chaperone Hfq [bacterium]
MAAKVNINVQDHFLNQARREKVKVRVSLINGNEVEGYIRSFDNYSCVVEDNGDAYLIYKHAIATVAPLIPEKMKTLISFHEK